MRVLEHRSRGEKKYQTISHRARIIGADSTRKVSTRHADSSITADKTIRVIFSSNLRITRQYQHDHALNPRIT
jgi:hypothetical protein